MFAEKDAKAVDCKNRINNAMSFKFSISTICAYIISV